MDNNWYRELFEVAPDAILEVDHEGAIRLVNEEAERLFGWPRSKLIGKRVEELLPERHRQGHLTHREHYHAHPTKRRMGSGLDLWALKADGTEFPVDIKLSPIQTDDGLRTMCVVRDVTERRRTEAQIRSLNENLERRNREVERANQLKSEFLASMSHELRTPLNAIIGFSDLLHEQSAGGVNEKQQRYLNHISHGARHLLTLINDILDLSKIEAGRLDLRLEKLTLPEDIEEVFTSMRQAATAKGLRLDIHVRSGLEFHADKTRFRQIIYNLLSNAVKFTPAEGNITVEAHAEGSLLRLVVSDTGIGIPPSEIETIFGAFHQAAETTKGVREGTGLGLAITKRLVELHRGRIWVESEVGRGSRFYVEIPPPSEMERQELKISVGGAGLRGENTLVLIVEDEDSARELLTHYLEPEGYDVAWVGSGSDALIRARELKPDAITLDIRLGDGSGWEILHRLKQDPETAHIPVVVISILDEPETGFTFGASDYLVKPVEKETLLAALRAHVPLSSKGAARLLVVDDDTETRYLLSEMLEAEGYMTLLAASGSQAFDILSRVSPAAILLDLIMPEVDGFEVLRRIREDRMSRDIPVFILTAKDLTERDLDYLAGKTHALFLKGEAWREALVAQLRLALREDLTP
ncbi:MAG TPA: response regulator [Terriglobales bacterium]|nr:response regulator [Terriglobales bacterium]